MAKEYNTPYSRNRETFQAMTDAIGTVPPQAVELEEAVLGALMLEQDSVIAVQEYLKEESFYSEQHQLIYRAIQELSIELKPIDLYTVSELDVSFAKNFATAYVSAIARKGDETKTGTYFWKAQLGW